MTALEVVFEKKMIFIGNHEGIIYYYKYEINNNEVTINKKFEIITNNCPVRIYYNNII